MPPLQGQLLKLTPQSPGDLIRQRLTEKGWTQDDLAAITGKSRQSVSDVIAGRTAVSPEMASSLAAAFENFPGDWLALDAAYRASQLNYDKSDVTRKARLFELAPIKNMQRRGWIGETDDPDQLQRELEQFFESTALDSIPMFSVSFRGSSTLAGLSAPEKVWCYQARKLARALQVSTFRPEKLDLLEKRLRELAAYPKEARHVAKLFADFGIRLVVVEHLPGSKVDGAAFWLDEHSPVIAISARIDRIDNLWFTVLHEFTHIRNGDALSIDLELMEEGSAENPVLIHDEAELRANEGAALILIPRGELESFVQRVSPLYSKERIVQFAHRIKIHPGIIVGQLQHRKEIGFSSHREMLAKVRSAVVETTLTDGWGRTVTPGVL